MKSPPETPPLHGKTTKLRSRVGSSILALLLLVWGWGVLGGPWDSPAPAAPFFPVRETNKRVFFFEGQTAWYQGPRPSLLLTGGNLVSPPHPPYQGDLLIRKGRIARVLSPSDPKPVSDIRLDCRGYWVFPGLINAHDHPLFNWSPPIAVPHPFRNYIEWYKSGSEHYDCARIENDLIPAESRLTLTCYKQIFSGVTTVECFTANWSKYYLYGFPIRMLDMFSHTNTLFTDFFNVPGDYARTKGVVPYFVHIEEGRGREVEGELAHLDHMGALAGNTVLIHAIGLSESDMERIARTGASVVWCPSSNLHLYGVTTPVPQLRKRGIPVCLGTDGALTDGNNLMEEMRKAREIYPSLSPAELVEMATTTAASVLGLERRIGDLKPGMNADLLLIPIRTRDAYHDLLDTFPEDIALLLVGGLPVYGDEVFHAEFESMYLDWERIRIMGRRKFLAGGLRETLNRIRKDLGYSKTFEFLPSLSFVKHRPPSEGEVPAP